MKTNEQNLLKHFALILRNRANGNHAPISTTLLKHFSRKELIEVIKKIHDGNIPKELDLILMENEELLAIIKDEMYIIAYITEKWSKEQPLKLIAAKQPSVAISKDKVDKPTLSNTLKDKKKP